MNRDWKFYVKNIKHTTTLESNVLDQHLGFFLTNWTMLFNDNKKMKGKHNKVVVN